MRFSFIDISTKLNYCCDCFLDVIDADKIKLCYPISVNHKYRYMAGRKKLNRSNLHARVAPQTADKLKEIAYEIGYIYNGEGSTGQLLDAIAQGKIVLIKV